MSSVDTGPLIEGVNSMLSSVFTWVPIGLAILAPVAAIAIGLKFGGRIVSMVQGAFGGGK